MKHDDEKTPDIQVNSALCNHLDAMLAMARAGELCGGVMIGIHPDGTASRRLNIAPSNGIGVLGCLTMIEHEIASHVLALERQAQQTDIASRFVPGTDTQQ